MKSQNENKTNLLSVKFNLNNSRPKTILLLNVRHEDIHIEKIKEWEANNPNFLQVSYNCTSMQTEQSKYPLQHYFPIP